MAMGVISSAISWSFRKKSSFKVFIDRMFIFADKHEVYFHRTGLFCNSALSYYFRDWISCHCHSFAALIKPRPAYSKKQEHNLAMLGSQTRPSACTITMKSHSAVWISAIWGNCQQYKIFLLDYADPQMSIYCSKPAHTLLGDSW